MATEIIRIGDTYHGKYWFYNPLPDSDPPAPDTDSPIDLTGVSVTWNLRIGPVTHSFAEGNGVTVTHLAGLIEVEIPKATTAEWKKEENAVSFLKLTYPDNDEKTKAHKRVRVLKRGEI